MRIEKSILTAIILCLFVFQTNAQTSKRRLDVSKLPKVYISEGVDLLFISPEPIEFVDLSTDGLIGDLPTENIARIKICKDSEPIMLASGQKSFGVITIVGKSFMAQYKTIYDKINKSNPTTNIQIQPLDMQPLEFVNEGFSYTELKRFSKGIFSNYKKTEKKPLRKKRAFKLKMQLNNVYVVDDYIFLDVSIFNRGNIKYNIEDLKFTIEDKKIYKAHNSQTISLYPIYQLFHTKTFRKKYRNIFVFKKFTFPNGKVLKIRMLENPISGRTIEVKIKYSDILNADVF